MREKIFIRLSSFTCLNFAQSLIVLNDSIFRLIVAYSLIDLLGPKATNQILSISGALFILPFICFIIPAGQIADRYSKQKLIVIALAFEVLFMTYGYFALLIRTPTTLYIALFLVALQAAFFSPMKYSIIPEIEPKHRLGRVNGYFILVVYLSIILGTFLASILSEMTDRNYPFIALLCLLFSFIAFAISLKIEKTPRQNKNQKIAFFFLPTIYRSLQSASCYPHLLLAISGSACFLFTAAYTQLNLIPFGMQSLGISDVEVGYIFLAAAIGVICGSSIVAYLSSDRVRIELSIWGAFGTSISYLSLYLLQHHLLFVILLVFSIGFHGGIFVAPLDAYVQYIAPKEIRAVMIATSGFLGFCAGFIAAITLYVLGDFLSLAAAYGFLIIGLFSFLFALFFTFRLKVSR